MLPRNYDPEDSIGLQRDILSEGRIRMENAEHQLSEINVVLDSLADDPEIWTDDELAELRSIQRSIQALRDEKGVDEGDTSERLAEVRDSGE